MFSDPNFKFSESANINNFLLISTISSLWRSTYFVVMLMMTAVVMMVVSVVVRDESVLSLSAPLSEDHRRRNSSSVPVILVRTFSPG